MGDLMAKCTEFESTRTAKNHVKQQDPYAWLKPLKNEDAQNMNEMSRFPKNTNSFKDRFNNKPKWQQRRPDEYTPRKFFRPKTFWNKKEQHGDKQQESTRQMNETDSDDDQPVELTRGLPREMTDSDYEYVGTVENENNALARRLNMDESDYLRYQENQTCSNCHLKGHTIDRCHHIRKGVWFEHCKKCHTPNSKHQSCEFCQKNRV